MTVELGDGAQISLLRGVNPKVGVEFVEHRKDASNFGRLFGVVDNAIYEQGPAVKLVVQLCVGRES
ncbi:hypothetical protein [Natronococcus jeotgali]|uniref:Uncharacterized protein n=1 Tax=Natronococcus jeotgali DSM 18795 TaxID=1227498 RepID=L9XJQ2_9EURY|nr:hypothetical protein [Natronococcus jeotgali]ELY61950.1 hypothetical protein C492_08940 [Natronococcus jeotgali DSM 18795]